MKIDNYNVRIIESEKYEIPEEGIYVLGCNCTCELLEDVIVSSRCSLVYPIGVNNLNNFIGFLERPSEELVEDILIFGAEAYIDNEL